LGSTAQVRIKKNKHYYRNRPFIEIGAISQQAIITRWKFKGKKNASKFFFKRKKESAIFHHSGIGN